MPSAREVARRLGVGQDRARRLIGLLDAEYVDATLVVILLVRKAVDPKLHVLAERNMERVGCYSQCVSRYLTDTSSVFQKHPSPYQRLIPGGIRQRSSQLYVQLG